MNISKHEDGMVDLHLHTYYSDGIYSPAVIVKKCLDAGLRALAVTDHETTLAFDEVQNEGKQLSLEVICGVEISAGYKKRELHILGYMNSVNPGLTERLSLLRNGRFERMEKMLYKLKKMNVFITPEDIKSEAGKAAPGRLHLARVMVEKGYISSLKEAFERFIGRGCSAYIPRIKLDIGDAINLLKENDALTFLAHPGVTNEGIETVRELKRKGLIGIEVFHPEHSPGMTELYKSIAEREGLLISGGSDYHGEGKPLCKSPGCVNVSYEYFKAIKKSLKQEVNP